MRIEGPDREHRAAALVLAAPQPRPRSGPVDPATRHPAILA
jgi:hypothetical protein